MTKNRDAKMYVAKSNLILQGAAAILIGLAAAAPSYAQTSPPPKVEGAPDLAPGIAPGVVPGARPGGMEPGATAPPAGASSHPMFAPGASGTSDQQHTDVSPSAVLGTPDWPCVQRKVPTISPAQVWDGPSIDEIKEFDPGIRDLTEVLESRRVSTEDAEKAIKEYAASVPEADRDRKLTELFASFLNHINSDRKFVMDRVEEYQKRQKARAAELEREGQKLAEKGLAATDELLPTETNLSPEQQEYNWNARIFQERQLNLTMACEVPMLIEQRAYEVARLIREQMKS
ncbi:MAG TPA: hypothetical protein VNR88_01735 [Hyphomicrobium sp.]|nr:hypothetical protein [Hyphomicrobium sp.]